MGIMYQQRMDMISDDIWMDKPPVFHGGNPHPSGDLSGVQRSPPKKPTEGFPSHLQNCITIPDHRWNLVSCPFGKNRGAGSWLIPSIIIYLLNGVSNPSINQPTNGKRTFMVGKIMAVCLNIYRCFGWPLAGGKQLACHHLISSRAVGCIPCISEKHTWNWRLCLRLVCPIPYHVQSSCS